MMSVTVHAAEPVTLYAAGSLRGANVSGEAGWADGRPQAGRPQAGPQGWQSSKSAQRQAKIAFSTVGRRAYYND